MDFFGSRCLLTILHGILAELIKLHFFTTANYALQSLHPLTADGQSVILSTSKNDISKQLCDTHMRFLRSRNRLKGVTMSKQIYSHVIVIGIDGAGSFIQQADTPHFDRIFPRGRP